MSAFLALLAMLLSCDISGSAQESPKQPRWLEDAKGCKFLDPDTRRCTIYHARPLVCREFPARARCAYYDLLQFERVQQGDDTVVPLVQITFRNGDK